MMADTRQESSDRFIVDSEGNRIGVVLDVDRYRALLDAAEELESIREYDAAKQADDESVPFDQAVREIEQER